MAAMRCKQAVHGYRHGPIIAAQHIWPAMQHFMIPHCTNCLDL
ncbi:hypothetical protein [Mesorhizobium sp. INR15]|nr:hypothetical protein [Mesorhizobium sp. INR15]